MKSWIVCFTFSENYATVITAATMRLTSRSITAVMSQPFRIYYSAQAYNWAWPVDTWATTWHRQHFPSVGIVDSTQPMYCATRLRTGKASLV